MRTKPLKQLLSATTILLLIAGVGVAALGFNLPIHVPDVESEPLASPATERSQSESQHVPELAALQRLARKDLRQRLFDPPPEPKPVIPPKPPPSIRLLGTIVNADNSQAMISGPGGKTELKRIGDTVGEAGNSAVITDILTDHIKVEHENNILDVFIDKDGGSRR